VDQAFITPICCLVVALEHHCTALDLRAYVNLNKDQQAQTVAHSRKSGRHMCHLHDDEDINGIVILTQGARNEAIVVWVDHGGV
jgi:hypothetical protein